MSILAFNGAVFLPVAFSKPSLIAETIFSEVIKPETMFNLIAAPSLLFITSDAFALFFSKYKAPTYMSINILTRVPAPFNTKDCPSKFILASTLTPATVFCAFTVNTVAINIKNVITCFLIIYFFSLVKYINFFFSILK